MISEDEHVENLFSLADFRDVLTPGLLPTAPGAWHEHVPFAHWLIKKTRPRSLVELGTHAGVSFSAFCHAMRRFDVGGRAFAVDHWRGDGHAGIYSEKTYQDLNKFVNEQYRDFAQLLKMPFDEALEYFSENSVDILHIDGLHTYEAVKHDFNAWLPKMSDRGIVLFHDIHHRGDGFGVWRFWEEIRIDRPSFEFIHGAGLGVLVIGDATPAAILQLALISKQDHLTKVRGMFAAAGRFHGNAYNAWIEYSENQRLLKADREAVDADRRNIDARLKAMMAERDAVSASLPAMVNVAEPKKSRIEQFGAKAAKALARIGARNDERIKKRGTHTPLGLRLRAAWRHPLKKSKRRNYRLQRLLGQNPPQYLRDLQYQARAETILAHFNRKDEIGIRELVARNVLPSVYAVIFVDGATIAHLDTVLQSVLAQEKPVANIFLYLSGDLATIPNFHAPSVDNNKICVVRQGEPAPEDIAPASGALLIAGSATLREGSVAIFSLEMLKSIDLVYSDEVFVDAMGAAQTPFFKPGYSPRLAENSDYLGSCGMVAFREENARDELQRIFRDYDRHGSVARVLTSRAAQARPGGVAHTPYVLFEETDPARSVLRKPRSRPKSTPDASVSILIPTKDRLDLLEPCVRSILRNTAYSRDLYEIVIIDNGSREAATLEFLKKAVGAGEIRVVRDRGNFNFSRLNNRAAATCRSDVLLFLNNDTIITQADWLHRMAACAMEDDVGVVGARLLYGEGSVQHGGVVLGIQGVAAHADVMRPAADAGYYGLSRHDREVSAVTGACMATQRARFEAVKGFDENLAVAFNDTLLCTRMLGQGFVNMQLNSVLVTHLESMSRGLDDTPERMKKFQLECRYTREQSQSFFLEDRYYNPNLSLTEIFTPAEMSRRRKPWRTPAIIRKPSVLLLSCTHELGHGVPVVIAQQARFLSDDGFEVHVGGPASTNDIAYTGCVRAIFSGPSEALAYAKENDIDILIPHTPPFFTVSRSAGPYPIVAAYDHGEPPADLFPDASARRAVLQEKAFSLMLAHRLYCNSASVKRESGFTSMIVVPLGNSHMNHWSAESEQIRRLMRASRDWDGKVVVLNVCRFRAEDRHYKGVDFFLDVAALLVDARRPEDPDVVFVQAGTADKSDVAFVESNGAIVAANVSNEEMIGLYCAADIYANFSQWEGWNLGIAQALAFGLPVVASDIAAHRLNFDVDLADTPDAAARLILDHARRIGNAQDLAERKAVIHEWRDRLQPLAADLEDLWRNVHS